MTRIITCGWETGVSPELGISTPGAGVSSSGRPPGAYCLNCNAGSGAAYAAPTFSAKTEIWVRWSWYAGTPYTSDTIIFSLLDASGGVHVTLVWNVGGDQLLRLRLGGSGGTLMGTSSMSMPQGAWHTLEVRWKATTTTSSTDGIVEVWLNGTRVINLAAVDNTNTAVLNVGGINVGTLPGGGYGLVDDLAINDTNGTLNNGQIGDGRIVFLKPSAVGSNTNQTRGGTDTGANWSQVNEIPMSMAQYVGSATIGARDTYALQDLPAGSWAVNCVDVFALCANSDSLPGSIGLTTKSGATIDEIAPVALSPAAVTIHQFYETDPNTPGVAWTNAAVNALEVGTTVR